MILPSICKRVSKFSAMITQLNQFNVLCPVVNGKPNARQNLRSISLKVRCFCGARLAHNHKMSCHGSTQLSSSLYTSRVSRATRTEAQGVLFDYLHSTRNLSFMDAEYISKNSPHFLRNLLAKIDTEKDVAQSLGKFLRYNPINEFEPFFESLGLSPSEISLLLPRQFMFLSDDHLLLENIHVLCDYGVPRSKMGKMYKEAREIFGYDYGLLTLKLQAYENLGLSQMAVIKLVSCCPSLLVGGVDSEFIKVLQKLNRVGFKNDWIGGYLSGEDSYNWKRMLDTMDFLDKVGHSEEQLRNLFKTNPALVFEGSGKKVYVVFGRLLKLGLKMSEVYSLFRQNPQILSAKCAKNLFRAVDILLCIGMGAEDIGNIVSTQINLFCSSSLKGPKTLCKELKVKEDSLCQIIREDPLKLFKLASKSEVKSTEQLASEYPSKKLEKAAFLLRLGFVENSDEMMKALKRFRGRGDQLQERFDCLIQAGLDYNAALSLIKHAPMVLNQTKDVIEKKIDCLTNCLGYPLESVITFPAYLCYDLERINHRFKMYVWLIDRGAAKPTLSLSTILACSDARFVKYFVDVDPEGPAVWESLRTSSALS